MKNPNERELEDSIAYCGLVCKLCHLAATCSGCKGEEINCEKYLSDEGCFHRDCCIRRNMDGCWECDEFPCERDMFIGETNGEIRGFCTCIKEEGKSMFIKYLLRNMDAGIKYGIESYGDLNEAEVVKLLRNGSVK